MIWKRLQPMHRQVMRLVTAQAFAQTASILVMTVGSRAHRTGRRGSQSRDVGRADCRRLSAPIRHHRAPLKCRSSADSLAPHSVAATLVVAGAFDGVLHALALDLVDTIPVSG
jgi:hypothetical protein